MKKFVFEFDSVIRIKEVFEKKVMKEISLIDKEIEQSVQKQKSLNEKKSELHKNINSGNIKVYEYRSAKSHIRILEKEVINYEKKIEELKSRKEQKRLELVQKKKELKIFETLKENKKEEFLFDYNREELKQLNELAINNFIRKEK
ncbi:MAG: flagellar export protein FliJ [Bacteroidota bacterium]